MFAYFLNENISATGTSTTIKMLVLLFFQIHMNFIGRNVQRRKSFHHTSDRSKLNPTNNHNNIITLQQKVHKLNVEKIASRQSGKNYFNRSFETVI